LRFDLENNHVWLDPWQIYRLLAEFNILRV
jgi:hypothetical protein